jgi:hypothetical protein
MNNNIKFNYLKTTLLTILFFSIIVSCEREFSDEVEFATFSNTAEVFTDTPIGLGSNFYFPYTGSKATAWSVDNKESYMGTASMRFDVPNADDPEGGYAGAIFRIDGAGRNLTEYDALTFWAKSSQAATVAEIGFGEDFEENKYITTLPNLKLTTNWVKYIIPIPDPSKLIGERGMLRYAAGGIGPVGQEVGYTFWIDELKFEKLGNIGQPRPAVLDGADIAQQTFTGTSITLTGLTETFNLGTGYDQTVSVAPSYFTFSSSDVDVAQVNEMGVVSVVDKGTAEITAILAGVAAKGSLKVTSIGALPSAPVPTRPEADVKSIYSDAYPAETGSNFTPNFGGSTTETTEVTSNGNSVLIYANNNYTGILFDSTVDASTLTHLHIDIYTQNAGTNVGIQIRDIGANGIIETDVNTGNPIGDDKDYRFTATGITVGQWTSFEIPLGGDLTSQKNNLGALIITGGPDFILDNIYFYK